MRAQCTFQLTFFGPVLLGAPHGLDELDEEGDSLVDVLPAVCAAFHCVMMPTDLQHSHKTSQSNILIHDGGLVHLVQGYVYSAQNT